MWLGGFVTLSELFSELAESAGFPKEKSLVQLSGLISEEIAELKSVWPNLSNSKRLEIMNSLVELAEQRVELDFTPVFKIGLGDDDNIVKEKAIFGLWECEERSLMSALINFVKKDPADNVRASAAQALGKFAALAEENKLMPQDRDRVRQILIETYNNDNEVLNVRRRSIESLGLFCDDQVRSIIRDAYGHQSSKVRESALYAMGNNADPIWIPIVIKEMSSDFPSMRYEAAHACGGLGDESSIPYLIPLVQDEDFQVRLAAIDALGAIGGSSAKRILQQCLRSNDETIRESAREALEQVE